MPANYSVGDTVLLTPEFVALGYPSTAIIEQFSPAETDQYIVRFITGERKRIHRNCILQRLPTVDEFEVLCNKHSHCKFKNFAGKLITLKINGKPKRWKRQPNRIKIPVKYGLYEFGYLTEHDIPNVTFDSQLSKTATPEGVPNHVLQTY